MQEAHYIRRIWNFSKALDLALIDEEIEKGFKASLGHRHGERVAYIALSIGKGLSLTRNELTQLLIAGLVHDIGAVGGFRQFHGDPRLIREHCLLGAEIVKRFPDGEVLSRAIRYHHESPNPVYSTLGAKEEDVSLMAKILSLADKLDVHMHRGLMNRSERENLVIWVKNQAGKMIYPEVIPAFLEAANREAFWLDLAQTDLLTVSLQSLYGQGDFLTTSLIDTNFNYELALTFAELIDQKSAFTARHSLLVADVAEQLARGLGWEEEALREMRIASLLHDLGKLSVPGKILDKPGKLEKEEIEIIRTHTYYTFHLLAGAGFPMHIVRWAAYHHERLDGLGYPFGIKADELDTGARLLTIADIYAALTEERPYRKALSPGEALGIISRGEGKHVDPGLVQVARRVLG